jgi:hypothetical protein
MSKRKLSVLSSNIPTARDICDSLGFYGSKAKSDLCDFSLNWREAYTTSGGCPGTKLLKWKSEQEELKIMAEAFLPDAEKEEFWSSVKGGDSVLNSSNEKYAILLFQ